MPDASMPGALNTPVLAPVTADGMPVAALGRALSGRGGTASATRFWSTPPRAAADATREVLEVSLGAARTVNTVSVSLPRFPHTTWLQAHDEDNDTWVTLSDAAGNPASVTITDSLPPVVSVGVAAEGRRHPAHHGAGHWVPTVFTTSPTVCSRIRLVQVRRTGGIAPVTPTGTPAPYPLGARDLIVGYDTTSPGGAPLRTGTTATTSDILGSTLAHTVRRASAANLLLAAGTWRSAPQASPNAVVSLYADIRDALGQPQVIDRLDLDPITSGVSMCVYYSPTAPIADRFPASDTPLADATVPAAVNPATTPAGLVFTGTGCWLDIAANATGFDPGSPFALGIAFAPAFASTSPTTAVVLDTGALSLTYTTGMLTAALGALHTSVPVTFSPGTPLAVGISYDGTALTLTVGTATTTATATPATPNRGAAIRIGADVGTGAHPAAMTLSSLLLWQCSTATAATGLAAYLADPAAVLALPATDTGPHPTDGTVLRVDPSLADAANPFAVFGGPGIDTSAVTWTPLARDATARAGALALPPMRAALVKVEFTNLAPAPFETAGAVPTLAPLADPGRSAAPAPSATGSPDAGTAVMAATGAQFYSDMRRLPGANVQAISPTEALYAPDPRVAAQLNDAPGFGFTPWQNSARPVSPRPAGAHTDPLVEAQIGGRAAFFVALRSFGVGRSGASGVPQDYDRVLETMADGLLLGGTGGAGGWLADRGRLVTPTPCGGPRVAGGVPYLTHHPVVAVQLATTCSDALQVIPDADFTAVDLSAWTALGDATLGMGTGYASAVGHAASVARGGGGVGGIASAVPFTPGRTGRLHGAVRIYTPEAASAPWTLSLVNGDGSVLASAQASPGAGQLTEFICSVHLDTPPSAGTNTWGHLESFTWAQLEAQGTWAAVSGSATWIRDVTVRLQQTGVDDDLVYVDSLAMFYDPITWEVSADGGTSWFNVSEIRNDPAAVFVFPVSSPASDQLVWRATCDAPGVSVSAVALRPWYELRPGGVRPAPPGIPAGPQLSPADHYGPIEDDPMWQAWHNPVPRSWWSGGHPPA